MTQLQNGYYCFPIVIKLLICEKSGQVRQKLFRLLRVQFVETKQAAVKEAEFTLLVDLNC